MKERVWEILVLYDTQTNIPHPSAEPRSPLRAREVTNITVFISLGEKISFPLPDSPMKLVDSRAKSTLNNAMGVL